MCCHLEWCCSATGVSSGLAGPAEVGGPALDTRKGFVANLSASSSSFCEVSVLQKGISRGGFGVKVLSCLVLFPAGVWSCFTLLH